MLECRRAWGPDDGVLVLLRVDWLHAGFMRQLAAFERELRKEAAQQRGSDSTDSDSSLQGAL